MGEKLMSVDDVCAWLQVHPTTLYRWRQSGEFPQALQIGKRRLAWRESDLLVWLETRASE